MKELTKDQLIDLTFEKCHAITMENSANFGQRIADLVERSQKDGVKMIVDFVTVYGNEIRKECCQTVAEILYDVLYSEQ